MIVLVYLCVRDYVILYYQEPERLQLLTDVERWQCFLFWVE